MNCQYEKYCLTKKNMSDIGNLNLIKYLIRFVIRFTTLPLKKIESQDHTQSRTRRSP